MMPPTHLNTYFTAESRSFRDKRIDAFKVVQMDAEGDLYIAASELGYFLNVTGLESLVAEQPICSTSPSTMYKSIPSRSSALKILSLDFSMMTTQDLKLALKLPKSLEFLTLRRLSTLLCLEHIQNDAGALTIVGVDSFGDDKTLPPAVFQLSPQPPEMSWTRWLDRDPMTKQLRSCSLAISGFLHTLALSQALKLQKDNLKGLSLIFHRLTGCWADVGSLDSFSGFPQLTQLVVDPELLCKPSTLVDGTSNINDRLPSMIENLTLLLDVRYSDRATSYWAQLVTDLLTGPGHPTTLRTLTLTTTRDIYRTMKCTDCGFSTSVCSVCAGEHGKSAKCSLCYETEASEEIEQLCDLVGVRLYGPWSEKRNKHLEDHEFLVQVY